MFYKLHNMYSIEEFKVYFRGVQGESEANAHFSFLQQKPLYSIHTKMERQTLSFFHFLLSKIFHSEYNDRNMISVTVKFMGHVSLIKLTFVCLDL